MMIAMREWKDAETYHKVSAPQTAWGTEVLERLTLRGDELVLDVGCGTGKLTAKLLERLPRGRVLATDLSQNMLRVAQEHLKPAFGSRAEFACADAAALPVSGKADAIFSTATFHWVLDHPRLFRSLHAALKPGGRLVAQCGGKGNIERLTRRCAAIEREPAFARYFDGWNGPWEYADADTTASRLEAAGFTDIHTWLQPAPAVFDDAAAYREFVTNVVCRQHLNRLPDEDLRRRFVDLITEQAAQDAPAFELDYLRLNLDARRGY